MNRRVLLRPLACCLLIYALLVVPLDAQSIWWDEGISLHLAGLPWGEILRDRAANIHPPLYFLILRAWTGLAGRTPFAGRALSALAITLLPAAVYRFLTRRVCARAGRAAALLVALAPPFIIYGQETRAYALLPVGVIALWSLVWPASAGGPIRNGDDVRRTLCGTKTAPAGSSDPAALRGTSRQICSSRCLTVPVFASSVRQRGSGRRRSRGGHVPERRLSNPVLRGVLLGVVQAGLIGLHYAGAIAAGVAALGYGLRWLRGLRRGTARDIAREWLTGSAVVLLCLAPWAVVVAGVGLEGLGSQAGLSNALTEPAPVGFVASLLGIFHTTGLPEALDAVELVSLGVAIGGLVLLGSAAVLLRTGPKSPLAVLLSLWLLPFGGAPVIWFLSPQSHPRYLFAFVVGGWLVTAVLATHRGLQRAPRTVLLATLLVSNLLGLRAYFKDPAYARSDVRAAAATIRERAVVGDVALVPYGDWSLAQYDLGPAELAMVPALTEATANAPVDESLAAAAFLGDRGMDCTVFVLDYERDALDSRGDVRAALAWGGVLVAREPFHGVFVERYEMTGAAEVAACEPLPPVCVPGQDLCLVGAAYRQQPVSGAALPVVLCWTYGDGDTPASAVTGRYAVGLRLYGPAGDLMAAHNDLLVDAALRPTDQWPVQDVLSYHLVPVPVGALPAPHEVQVGVFDTQAPDRPVTLIDGGEMPVSALLLGAPVPAVTPWRDATLYATRPVPDRPVVALSPALRLDGAHLDRAGVFPGQTVYVSVVWRVTGDGAGASGPRLVLQQGRQVLAAVTSAVAFGEMPVGRPLLEAFALLVPSAAVPGTADVALVSGPKTVALGDVEILGGEHTFEVPPFEVAVQAGVGQVATLLGVDLAPGTVVTAGNPLTLTLIWRAEAGAAERDLKVFTHLVSEAGDLLAQHDGQPVNWTRPTPGWLAGEIIRDTHVLTWSLVPGSVSEGGAPAVSGLAALQVGLYDGETGTRVLWQDGQDALPLPIPVTVVGAADDGR